MQMASVRLARALATEIICQRLPCLGSEQAALDQLCDGCDADPVAVKDTSAGAVSSVAGGVNEPRNTRMYHRHRAHRAGLQRHVKGAASKPVVAGTDAGLAQGDNFSVGSRIVVGDVPVATLTQDTAFWPDQHRSDWNLVILALGALGQGQRVAHPGGVQIGKRAVRLRLRLGWGRIYSTFEGGGWLALMS